MPDLRRALASGRPLLMDGAMGTELQRAGIQSGECYERWNLTHRDNVRAVHRSYRETGAVCLVTNTFQANPAALARFGLADQLEAINHAAIEIARDAADGAYVIASVGPMDVAADPAAFDRTLRSLVGADGLLLETWSEQFDLAARRAISSEANPQGLPVLLSLCFCGSDRTSAPRLLNCRLTAREVAGTVANLGIATLGANCGRDIAFIDMVSILRDYRLRTDLPLLARPNAGTPSCVDGRWVYPVSPVDMACGAFELMEAGAQTIGGCCGTTPAHIAAVAERFISSFSSQK